MTEAGLRPLLLSSNHAGDATVLTDFMRTYGYLIITESGYQDAGTDEEALPRLVLNWDSSFCGLTIVWMEKGELWSHDEGILPAAFLETEENRRRRKLRLAFHRLLEKEAGLRDTIKATPHPWGVLTGVRPSKMLQRFFDQGLKDELIPMILETEFGLAPERADLLLQVCRSQRPFLPALDEGRKKLSLYLSYPFCPSRCTYCSFPGYELTRWRKWQDACHQAMEKEIRQVGAAATEKGFRVETFYFGGGTPTCM